jgi:cyanate permease
LHLTLGSYLMGVAFDAFHSYAPALAGFVVALIIASLLISHLDGYVFPVQGADTGSLSRGLAT